MSSLHSQSIHTSPSLTDSHFIKSWTQIHGYETMQLYYNHKHCSFSVILHNSTGHKLVGNTHDHSESVEVPLFDSKAGRQKFLSLQHLSASSPPLLNLIQFLRREVRYPKIHKNSAITRVKIACGGLLGGGAKVSRTISPFGLPVETEIGDDEESYKQVSTFLLERYKIQQTASHNSNDEQFARILAKKICAVLPRSESSNIQNHLPQYIDIYEEEFCAEAVLKLLGKSKKDGSPSLTDYTRNFASSTLSIELLRRGYFANQRTVHGVEHVINDRILAKLTEDVKPLIPRLENTDRVKAKGKPGDGLEAYFEVLEKRDQASNLIKSIPKNRAKKVLAVIKEGLGSTTDKEEELTNELCFAANYDQIVEKITLSMQAMSPMKLSSIQGSRSPSPDPFRHKNSPNPSSSPNIDQSSNYEDQSKHQVGRSQTPIEDLSRRINNESDDTDKISPLRVEENKDSTPGESKNKENLESSDKILIQQEQPGRGSVIKPQKIETSHKSLEVQTKTTVKWLSYLEKVRLSVLSELNLLSHELNTLVELYNMLKLDQQILNSASAGGKDTVFDVTKNLKLNDIRSLLVSMIKGYRENEATLESTELSSLIPLAFVQDVDIFRNFLDAFLTDLKNDVLIDTKKIKMLSLIIISALKNHNFQEYLTVDDLIQCLKILKPKIEDLSITSKNLNLQDVMNSLNDILFLMGFIGAKGVKGEYAELVGELTKHMQSHGLEKAFNFTTGKAKDPSLEIKRNYALEAFKRIEGTSYEDWAQNFDTLLQIGEIAIGIGKGIFASDLSSMTDALLQIKDLLVQAYVSRPKTWYDDVNNLRFLTHEPIEKILAEIFPEKKKPFSKNYAFFAAELLLSVMTQSDRRVKVKKAAAQAVWFLANGFDYRQQAGQSYPVKPSTFKLDKDIIIYVKKSMLNIAEDADVGLSIYIQKIVESPIKFEPNNKNEESIALVRVPKTVDQEESLGKQFYLRILKDKTPRLHALASIQEHSERTFEKLSIIVSYRVIERERDYDEDTRRKLENIISRTPSESITLGCQKIKSMDARTATKNNMTSLVESIATYPAVINTLDTKTVKQEATQEDEDKKRKEEVSLISKTLQEKIDEAVKLYTFDIFDVLEKFLDDPLKRVLVIQGDAGSGKTMLVRLFEQQLWRRYNTSLGRDASTRCRLPVRVVLSEVRSLNRAVDELLIKHGCDSVGVRDIKRKPAAVLFDGYDEINQWINLYNLNNLDEWKDAKVIFTSRRENLTALKEDYIYCFTPGRDISKILSYIIQPINEQQIRRYFKDQSTKDQQEADRLEKVLKDLEHKSGQADYKLFEAWMMKQVQHLENFPQSEEYQHLCEVLHSLDEYLPEIEQLQRNIDAMEVKDADLSPVTEAFKKRIELIRSLVEETRLQDLITFLKEKIPKIRRDEILIDFVGKALKDTGPYKLEFANRIALNHKPSNYLQSAGVYVMNSSFWGLDPSSKERVSDQIEKWITIYEERCTPEAFKETLKIMREDLDAITKFLEDLKAYKSMQVLDNDSLFWHLDIPEFFHSIENFSKFERVTAFIKKTKEVLPAWKAAEEELISLKSQKETESLQPNKDKEEFIETSRMKRLRAAVQTHKQNWREFQDELKILDLFKKHTDDYLQITDSFQKLCDEDAKKHLEAEFKLFQHSFSDFRTRMKDIIYLSEGSSIHFNNWAIQVYGQARILQIMLTLLIKILWMHSVKLNKPLRD